VISNRILTLQIVDGVPVVPGAVDVSSQENGLYVAYGAFAKGVNTKQMRGPDQVVAYLWEAKPGLFAVFADDFAAIDPLGTGETMKDWKKIPANMAQWPWFKLDEYGDLTTEPTVPSSCGPVDLVSNLDNATAVTP
jgi:hypothetical protein